MTIGKEKSRAMISRRIPRLCRAAVIRTTVRIADRLSRRESSIGTVSIGGRVPPSQLVPGIRSCGPEPVCAGAGSGWGSGCDEDVGAIVVMGSPGT